MKLGKLFPLFFLLVCPLSIEAGEVTALIKALNLKFSPEEIARIEAGYAGYPLLQENVQSALKSLNQGGVLNPQQTHALNSMIRGMLTGSGGMAPPPPSQPVTGTVLPTYYGSAGSLSSIDSGPLQLPCAEDKLFSDSTGNLPYLRKCSAVLAFVKNEFEKQNKFSADMMYQKGLSVDSSAGINYKEIFPNLNNSKNEHYSFPKPTCSIMANRFNSSSPETSSNHLGESCGPPMGHQVDTSPNGTAVHWNVSGALGTLENSYYGGAYIQSLACFEAQVAQEVEKNKSLKLSRDCQILTLPVRDLGNQLVANMAQIKDGLGHQPLVSELSGLDLDGCTNEKLNSWDTSDKTIGMDRGKLRIGKTHLCTTRSAVESIFAQAMRCETFSRAAAAYQKEFTDMDRFIESIQKGPANVASSVCTPRCAQKDVCVKFRKIGFVKVPYFAKAECDSCANRCADEQYETQLREFLKNRLIKWDPQNPESVCKKISSVFISSGSANLC